MGRPVSFDFASGGGSTAEFLMGEVEIEPTFMHNVGTRIVLPDTVTLPLVNGKAVHPDMAISPDGPEPAWAYKITVRSGMTGRAWSEFRGVPTGTTQIAYKDLPKFVTTIPPETTAGMMQNWADTAQDGAYRAETAADRAEAPTDLMNKNLIEDTASLTNAALTTAFVQGGLKGLFVDVTAPPYKAKGNGTADDYAAINQAAIDMETFGGGTVFMPKGVYRTSAYLRPRNYVRYQGVGIGRTVIKPYQSAAFTGHGTLETPIESPSWMDITWDGSDIPAGNSLKGQFSEFLRNALWERVECKNFTATGFGSDFLPGGRYINCIASGNGRGQAVGGPGMSGFGIGTGKYEVEDVLVQGCLAFGNTNYGGFVEKQGASGNAPYYSKGVRFIGNHFYGNGWGLGGCGVELPVYQGNICAGNTYDGITLHEGTGVAPLGQPDKRATVIGNKCYDNGRDGINIDYEKNSLSANRAYHVIDANECYNNGRDGLRIVSSKWNSDVVRGIKIGAANRFDHNVGHGVAIVKAAGAEANAVIDDMHIAGFDANHNGGSGLYIGVSGIRWVIDSAKLYDDQVVKTQKFGIEIAASVVLTNAVVKDCDLVNNLTAPTSWNLATNFAGYTIIDGNHGYYGGYVAVPLTASPVTYTAGFTKETFYFHGMPLEIKVKPRNAGAFITVGTTSTAPVNLVLTTLELDPGDSIEIAYTGAVSSVKSIRR